MIPLIISLRYTLVTIAMEAATIPRKKMKMPTTALSAYSDRPMCVDHCSSNGLEVNNIIKTMILSGSFKYFIRINLLQERKSQNNFRHLLPERRFCLRRSFLTGSLNHNGDQFYIFRLLNESKEEDIMHPRQMHSKSVF